MVISTAIRLCFLSWCVVISSAFFSDSDDDDDDGEAPSEQRVAPPLSQGKIPYHELGGDTQQIEERSAPVSLPDEATGLNADELRKANQHLSYLSRAGFGLQDIIALEGDLLDFSDLKEAIAALRGTKLSTMPSDSKIASFLQRLANHISTYVERGYVLSLDQVFFSSLVHNPTHLAREAPSIDYSALLARAQPQWLAMQQRRKTLAENQSKFMERVCAFLFEDEATITSAWEDFYLQIYLALKEKKNFKYIPAMLKVTSGFMADSYSLNHAILINFLAGIKNPEDEQKLSDRVVSSLKPTYSCRGIPRAFLDEIRFKLLCISLCLPKMDKDDKRVLLDHLLHAGANCTDAKKSAIDAAFSRFCPERKQQLEKLLYGGGGVKVDLKRKATVIAAREKALKLQRIISNTIDYWIGKNLHKIPDIRGMRIRGEDGELVHPIRVFKSSSAGLEKERISAEAATWDYFAPILGLPLKGAAYPAYTLLHLHEKLFIAGNYSPRRLYDAISAEMRDDILNETCGFLQHLFVRPEAIILGKLQQWKFLIDLDRDEFEL